MAETLNDNWFSSGVAKHLVEAFPAFNIAFVDCGTFETSLHSNRGDEIIRLDINTTVGDVIHLHIELKKSNLTIPNACVAFSYGGEDDNNVHLKEFTEGGLLKTLKGIFSGEVKFVVLRRRTWLGREKLSLEVEGAPYHSSVVMVRSWL